jgi:hypothetical protein
VVNAAQPTRRCLGQSISHQPASPSDLPGVRDVTPTSPPADPFSLQHLLNPLPGDIEYFTDLSQGIPVAVEPNHANGLVHYRIQKS